jgi:hypothetical protein
MQALDLRFGSGFFLRINCERSQGDFIRRPASWLLDRDNNVERVIIYRKRVHAVETSTEIPTSFPAGLNDTRQL